MADVNTVQTLQQAKQCFADKNYRQAVKICLKLLKNDKDNPSILQFLAINLNLIKRYKAALGLLDRACKLAPTNPILLHNFASILKNQGEIERAIYYYQQALRFAPDLQQACLTLANTYLEKREFTLAIELLERFVENNPENLPAIVELINLLLQLKETGKALLYYELLKFYKATFEANYQLGLLSLKIGFNKNASIYFAKAHQENPGFYPALFNLGAAYYRQQQFEKAIEFYQKCLKANPKDALVYRGLALAYIGLEKFSEAENLLKTALKVNPKLIEVNHTLGFLYEIKRDFQQAYAYYQSVLSVAPNYVETHFNLAHLYLTLGNFTLGWKEYEWRWQKPELSNIRRKFIRPRWQGQSLENKTLLVFSEQGYGDAIQFCRYLPLIQKGSGKIIFECREPLLTLMKSLKNIDAVIKRNEPLPAHDYYIPLLSLPLLFNTQLNTIPNQLSYLSPPENLVKKWQDYFSDSKKYFKIGICWAGSSTNRNDRYRSCQKDLFSPLLSLPKVKIFSLQKNEEILPQKRRKEKYIEIGHMLENFDETAACISQLDLIITIDTAIAHLAGVLAKPTWILLSYIQDWRWLLDREDSPWYPTMRLFRQPKLNDWPSVIENVKKELMILLRK